MVVDYEAAWIALQDLVASKSQHGRDALLKDMARIAAEARVPAGELSRWLRLYGVEVERARSTEADIIRDDRPDFDAGFGSAADPAVPGHHDRGGHDGAGHAEHAGAG